ncbi:MAG: N-acyl-D-aspartate/D-glutamate deacylase [Paraglaciecola psychrophila]|jgi:N-acyl-D-aspartate/D-glutamate deacylase
MPFSIAPQRNNTMIRGRWTQTGRSIQAATLFALTLIVISCSQLQVAEQVQYDLVITGGRVIDPESGFDQQANVAINGQTIVAISNLQLTGIESIDASGLVVSPGFIDLHSHALSKLGQQLQVMDGVTTALELEAGVYPIDSLAQIFSGESIINYGASTSHLAIRQRVMENIYKPHLLTTAKPLPLALGAEANSESFAQSNAAFFQVASEQQRNAIQTHLQQGIDSGGLGIGFLLDYLSDAINADEIEMIFQLVAAAEVPVFVHIRRGLPGDPAGIEEVIRLARKHSASVHVCHLNVSAMGGIYHFLTLIKQARAEGVDITTEVYPYNAGSTSISAAVFSRDWQSIFGISYQDVEWAATGERFTQSLWNDYRQRFPGGQVIHHYGNEAWTQAALKAPGVIIASDAMPISTTGDRVHPRGIGTFSKVLRRYTTKGDNSGTIGLITALAKMTVLPAKRMETFAPSFKHKGRLREGFDADLTIFDPKKITDNATFQQPLMPSKGIQYVLVNGEFVLKEGRFVAGTFPGKLIKGAAGKTAKLSVSK